jgi:hypothetical protein
MATPAGASFGTGADNGAEHTNEAELRTPATPNTSAGALNPGNRHDASNGITTVTTQTDSQETK